MRAAVYCRISDDRRGLGLGVKRQLEDCLALTEQRGWTFAGAYTDNDVSAYSGKPRPKYRELLDAIDAGLVDCVVAWHPDRLHRSPVELESFITLVERTGVTIETVRAGEWDLSTPSGRLVARQLGSVSRYESEHKSERVRRALEQRADSGKAHGRRAFGWRRVYDEDGTSREVLDPTEADVIRDAAKRLLGGASLRSIAAELDASDVEPPGGPHWTASALRGVLLRERNAGRLVRHGEVVGVGAWERALDDDTYDQLVAVLRDPERRTATATAARYLLSGLGRCGVCGGRIRSSTTGKAEDRRPKYACENRCVARDRERVDEVVRAVIVERLARPDAADLFRADHGSEARAAAAEAAKLQERLDAAADSYAEGAITARQLDRITARLRPQIEAAEGKARVVDNAPVLVDIAGRPDAARIWDALPLARQRAIMDLLLTVTIEPTRKGRRSFDPRSVTIEWRHA